MDISEALARVNDLLEKYDSTDHSQRKVDLMISALTIMREILRSEDPTPVALTWYSLSKKEEIKFDNIQDLQDFIDNTIQYALYCQKAKDIGVNPEIYLAPLKILLLELTQKRFHGLEQYAKL